MKEELAQELNRKYPLLFRNKSYYGPACRDGWFALIDELCSELHREYDNAIAGYDYINEMQGQQKFSGDLWTEEDLVKAFAKVEEAKKNVPAVSQIKEKFGTLRFYVGPATPEQHSYIHFAESMSSRICEACGATHGARTWPANYMSTLCEKHAIEQYGEEWVNQVKL